ncbi:MAG: DUF4350 domain-containing protein [Candidatus Sumerlaeota bacterium]|nr:DUF4350 domain-containing protein [Candidatus Sumerlaeota bacterium]
MNRFAHVVVLLVLQLTIPRNSLAAEASSPGAATVLFQSLPPGDGKIIDAIESALRDAGFQVAEMNFDQLLAKDALAPESTGLLVLADSATFPAEGAAPLERFLGAGGRMIVVGAKPFQTIVRKVGERWVGRAEESRALGETAQSRVFLDFDKSELGEWKLNTKTKGERDLIALDSPGADGTVGCAKVTISDLQNYFTVQHVFDQSPFGEGEALTCFWAKGDANTPKLSVSWTEQDGSRWIGVIDVTPEWRAYAMKPEEFKFWKQGSPASRGKKGDVFHPANARTFAIGLAQSHTGPAPGPHVFWFDQLGAASNPLTSAKEEPVFDLPGLSPWSRLYPVEDPAEVAVVSPILSDPKAQNLPDFQNVVCPEPQGKGQGFENGFSHRLIPLAAAKTGDGRVLGYPVSLVLNLNEKRRLAAWGEFTFDDPDAWANGGVRAAFSDVARRLATGHLLADGGTELMAYFEGESVKLGATVANLGTGAADANVRITVRSKSGEEAFSKTLSLSIEPRGVRSASCVWEPKALDPHGYRVSCELLDDDLTTDRIDHEFSVLDEHGRFDPDSAVTV